jgi:hypothetical protein
VLAVAGVVNSSAPVVDEASVSVPMKPVTDPLSTGMGRPTFWLNVSAR